MKKGIRHHLIPSILLLALSLVSTAWAAGGLDPTDPMVRITAPKGMKNGAAVLAAVSRDVKAATGLGEEFVTYYWQAFDSIHCMGQAATDKPLFVDLYVPGFFTDAQVGGMMIAIADSLAKHTGMDKKWVFIHTHFPLQDQVYISGAVSHWDDYRGKKAKAARDPAERALDKLLFNDQAFVFQSLWRTSQIAAGGGDLGEILTVASQVKDFDKQSWHSAWKGMAEKVRALADSAAAAGRGVSAMQRYFRATEYYRASSIYLFGDDPRGAIAWQDGRDCFLKAAQHSGGRIKPVRIPYEQTTLPGYLVTDGAARGKRPLLLIQTGLDGTAEDLYFIFAAYAVKRGYNCLIYEGPGQGEMIVKQNLPFRHDWEKVVTPVVDYALTLPDTDPERLAIIGYSMGGYLVPRALAFEKRIRWAIADGGVMSPLDGTLTKVPAEVKDSLGAPDKAARVNELTRAEMEKHPEFNQFINQMLWTFQAASPSDLFEKLRSFDQRATAGQITADMLVVNAIDDRIAGSYDQSKMFFNALKTTKTYLEFDASQGAQFHCQNGAPLVSSEGILDWLDERAKP